MYLEDLLAKINLFHKLAVNQSEILKQLSRLETFKDRVDYAEKHLEHLSSGSSRVIYITPNKEVLKLAKNERGVAQNRVEANPKMQSRFINKTLQADKNGLWKISPYLEKITEKEFEELAGIPFKDFGEAISYGLQDVSGNSHDKPSGFEKVARTELYKELVRIGKQFKLMGGDIGRISSWGTKDDLPVLLDSGLSKAVFDEYYESSS